MDPENFLNEIRKSYHRMHMVNTLVDLDDDYEYD